LLWLCYYPVESAALKLCSLCTVNATAPRDTDATLTTGSAAENINYAELILLVSKTESSLALYNRFTRLRVGGQFVHAFVFNYGMKYK
jgi:hypothetical protein